MSATSKRDKFCSPSFRTENTSRCNVLMASARCCSLCNETRLESQHRGPLTLSDPAMKHVHKVGILTLRALAQCGRPFSGYFPIRRRSRFPGLTDGTNFRRQIRLRTDQPQTAANQRPMAMQSRIARSWGQRGNKTILSKQHSIKIASVNCCCSGVTNDNAKCRCT